MEENKIGHINNLKPEFLSKPMIMYFSDSELIRIAIACQNNYGFDDEIAEKIYKYLEKKTGENFRL